VMARNAEIASGNFAALGAKASLNNTQIAQKLNKYELNEETKFKHVRAKRDEGKKPISFVAFKKGHEFAEIIFEHLLKENLGGDKKLFGLKELQKEARRLHFTSLNMDSRNKILGIEDKSHDWDRRDSKARNIEKKISNQEKLNFKGPKPSLKSYFAADKLAPIEENINIEHVTKMVG